MYSPLSLSMLAVDLSSFATTQIIVAATLLFLYVVVYRWWCFPRFHKKRGAFKGNFKQTNGEFLHKRRLAFPPPYPNGWFKLCDVDDLEHGNIVSVSALGKDWVIFRATTGERKVGVLPAFCPHLGAHLGQGGRVVGDCIQCPFHGWKLNTDGVCTEIPYSTAAIPATAKCPEKVVFTVWLKMVWVWHHAEGEPPLWQLDSRPNVQKMIKHGTNATEYAMHITDMAENAADYYHFNYLHRDMPVPILKWFIHMKYETELTIPEATPHLIYFTNWCQTFFLKFLRLPYVQQTRVTFEGPGIVHFDIQTPIGNIWLVKSNLPLQPFRLYSEDTWYADPSVPRWVVRLLATVARGALEQDRQVWENRLFTHKPHLVKGDGPFLQYRKWFDQFFSENSVPCDRADLTW